MATLTWYGHSAFEIEINDCKILIDPFFAPGCGYTWEEIGRVDAVLVTHDHGDHVGDALNICKRWDAMLGCVVGTAQALIAKGLPQNLVMNGIGFNIGGTLVFRNVQITMTQAFHSSDSGVPTGFILRLPEGQVIYHAGDTGIFSSMALLGELYKIRYALLPMGGVFTMDAFQAANAAKLIGAKIIVPMHWGTFPVLAQSTDEFRALLGQTAPSCNCPSLKPGEKLDI